MLINQSFTFPSPLNLHFIPLCFLFNLIQTYVVFFYKYLNWAWSILLHYSFFHHHVHGVPRELFEELGSCHTKFDIGSFEQVECVVCLSAIGEDDEKMVLRCGHVFHQVCLDRWLVFRNITCPLCRYNFVSSRFVSPIGEELLILDYCSTNASEDEGLWWLR